MEKKEKPQIQFDDWQKQILAAEGHIILNTGRQVGKTLTFATKAAERMVKIPNTKIIAVSLTEDQAFLMKIMTQEHIEKNYKPYLKVKKSLKPTKNTIHLNNGSSYVVRPVGNTGDAVRGFTGDVLIVDEASRMPELMWMAAKPTLLTTGGDIWMCSTPFGRQGYFYDCFQNKHGHFKVFHVNSEEVIKNRAITDIWTEKRREGGLRMLEEEKANMSELQYAQEYLGQFIDELRQYFPEETIDKVCTEKRRDAILKNRDYFLGVDIARLGDDDTTYQIIHKINKENLVHVDSQIYKKQLTTQTEDRILQTNSLYDFRRIYIDAGAGSLGVGIFDHLLRHEETKRKVVAINNRQIVLDRDGKSKQRLLKEDLYDNLRSLMEKNQIKLLDDEKVRLSLKSVQYEYVRKKNGLTQLRIFGNYTHIVEGLIRAAWCIKEKNINRLLYSFKP